MIHVTMREEEVLWESIITIQGSVGKVITPDSWETVEYSGETAHCTKAYAALLCDLDECLL